MLYPFQGAEKRSLPYLRLLSESGLQKKPVSVAMLSSNAFRDFLSRLISEVIRFF